MPQSKRAFQPLSLQQRRRQGVENGVVGGGVPPPTLPGSRAICRASFSAERAERHEFVPSCKAPVWSGHGGVRSPRGTRDVREIWFYLLLTLLCSAAVGFELWAGFKSAGTNQGIFDFVRQLLA